MSKLAEQFDAAAAVSHQAFAAGDVVTGIAAIRMAAQLVQIMRLLGPPAPRDRPEHGTDGIEEKAK